MKKFLFAILAFAAVASTTGCKKEETPEFDQRLSVSQNGTEVYVDDATVWRLEKQDDNTWTLYLDRTRFVEGMPFLDMEVRNLPNASESNSVFTYISDSVIPYYNGVEYPRYEMTGFACELDRNGELEVAFTCVGYDVRYVKK